MAGAEQIVRALGGRWRGQSSMCRCPAHDDRNPSLSTADGPDGQVLVHCHAGCSQEAVINALAALGLEIRRSDGTNGTGSIDDYHHSELGKPSHKWPYHDGAGRLVGYISRFDGPHGKTFRPLVFDNGRWRVSSKETGIPPPYPLFNLRDILARSYTAILVCEGEKAAEAASKRFPEMTATTAMHGANAPHKTDWSPLRGRDVTIWPDNDDAGTGFANNVVQLIVRAGAASVRIVSLPDSLPKGWDLADEPPAGLDAAKLLADALERKGEAHGEADRIVSSPTSPLAVARELVEALYTEHDHAGAPLLRVHGGDFFRWNGQCWPRIAESEVRSAAYRWLEHARYEHPEQGEQAFNPSRRKIDDVMDALRSAVLLDSKTAAPCWTEAKADFSAEEIVSMSNGLLHVPSRNLLSHTPHFFCHHSLAFPFSPVCGPPARWLEFLGQLWDDDRSSVQALQEMMGYILGNDTHLQKIFLFVGPKRSGKGTIGRVLTALLGSHNVAAPTLAGLATNFGLSPLIGKPLGLISDARLSGKSNNAVVVERLLSVSGEDGLTIDRKYREPWTGRLPTRFIVMTNELPQLTDSSGALASRFIIFVLKKSFYGNENPRLTDELQREGPAIFNWALEGLDRLNERGHFLSPGAGREAMQQLEDLSSPIAAFIRDKCIVDSTRQVEENSLWEGWKSWCESDNRSLGTKVNFRKNLGAAVPTTKRIRPRNGEDRPFVYSGIGLQSDG